MRLAVAETVVAGSGLPLIGRTQRCPRWPKPELPMNARLLPHYAIIVIAHIVLIAIVIATG
jgi:hypothetical protein